MQILEQRFLRGPNLHSPKPCLLTLLDLHDLEGIVSDTPERFTTGLLNLLPRLGGRNRYARFVKSCAFGSYSNVTLAKVIERIAVVLQRLTGARVQFGRTYLVTGEASQFRVICAYELEDVAKEAMAAATHIVSALARGKLFELEGPLSRLKEIAKRQRTGEKIQKLLSSAHLRGIPTTQSDEDMKLFQLGWGYKQRFILEKRPESGGQLVGQKEGCPLASPSPLTEVMSSTGFLSANTILNSLFRTDNGRIPVIAVTGTNGKTTTTLMLAHGARLAGRSVVVTTSEGVVINGQQVDDGDCSGYWSARKVFEAQDVDIAILETARGEILKRGLAFDLCDIAIVLNITEDHLGLDGVETLADLADVKAVVARTASKYLILNGDDQYCIDIGTKRRQGCEIIYFSRQTHTSVMSEHIAAGGRALYLNHGMVTLADGQSHHNLIEAKTMPIALDGHAEFNVSNALAAAASLHAAGFNNDLIIKCLATFESNGKSNPLRVNSFDIRGVKVIVDYAHNPAAYAAIGQLARSISTGSTFAVVTAPGDRRDAELRQIGWTCAQDFSVVIVYEGDPRGRTPGGTAAMIVEGVHTRVEAHCATWIKLDIREAVRFALGLAVSGDVIIFACATSVHELVDALKDSDPQSAQKITMSL